MTRQWLSLSFLFFFLISCGSSPKEKADILPAGKTMGWQYKGLERQRIAGKTVRVWEKPAQSGDEPRPAFVVLEVLKGADTGQFHIGFLITKQDLGILSFYEYDQRQLVNAKIQGQDFVDLSLRRVNWDATRDFLGFLNQGTSVFPAAQIYNELKAQGDHLLVQAVVQTPAGATKPISFELGRFQEHREKWLARVQASEQL